MHAGHAMARVLRQNGLPWVAGVSGESFLPLLDGLREEGLPFLGTCHEAGAVFLAGAYAQATGKPAVAAVTRGPGAANALIGIHEAHQAHLPLLLLVGQVDSRIRGRGALQEMEFTDVFRSVAKAVFEVTAPDQAAPAVLAALRKAIIGGPGPVVVSLPTDHLYGQARVETFDPLPATLVTHGVLPDDASRTIARLMRGAKRGVIICGAAFAGKRSAEAIGRFAEQTGFGVLGGHAFADVLPPEHPLWLGCSTIRGSSLVADLLDEADLLLVLGHWLGDRVTQGYRPLTARIIAVQRDPWVGWDEYLGAEFFLADPVAAVEQIGQSYEAETEDATDWTHERRAWVERKREALREEGARILAAEAQTAGAVPFAEIVETMDRLLPNDAAIVSDAGSFNDWIIRYFPFRGRRRYYGPISGSMGFAVPAAIGVYLAQPRARTLAMVGDGGFLMTGLELATAVTAQLPITVVVVKNGVWGSIAIHEDLRFPGGRFAVDLPQPGYAALATSLGAAGFTVQSRGEFEGALRAALALEGPSLIEVSTDALRPSPGYYDARGGNLT
ncbi:MAG TPA: thiamine pyrophosphate-binding protein [Chloroflexota bacterium]|nr:thiamine pyrophosphate-binding protein [Chloroflexota bacterium]